MDHAEWFCEGWRRAYSRALLRHGFYAETTLSIRRRWKRLANLSPE